MTKTTLAAVAFTATLTLSAAGCAALLDPIVQPGVDAYEKAYNFVATVREASIEVLAAIGDDAPCRAEWRRLAADATEAVQRAQDIYSGEVSASAVYGLEAGIRAQDRARRILLGRIATALDATVGCVQRGGLTMEEWVELEARGRRPDPERIDPAQQDALGRIGRPVA